MGENVHINCAAITVPEPDEIIWMYHDSRINEGKLISNNMKTGLYFGRHIDIFSVVVSMHMFP